MVPLTGIEPAHMASEANALSTELQGQVGDRTARGIKYSINWAKFQYNEVKLQIFLTAVCKVILLYKH